jgi:hypothetical protein
LLSNLNLLTLKKEKKRNIKKRYSLESTTHGLWAGGLIKTLNKKTFHPATAPRISWGSDQITKEKN